MYGLGQLLMYSTRKMGTDIQLTRDNSGHFLYNFTLDNSNHVLSV